MTITAEHKREATRLAGECLFHVRTALDHAVYQIAWRDSGARKEGTGFPLCKAAKDWSSRKKKELKHVHTPAREAIEAVQAFNGTEWTRKLEQLSNRDKHRTPVEVVPTLRFEVDRDSYHADPQGEDGYVGLGVRNVQILSRLIPADYEGEASSYPDAMEVIAGIVQGAAEFLNIFLPEEGISPLRVEAGSARASDRWSGRMPPLGNG